MSMSRQIYIGNYVKVNSYSDAKLYGFIENAEDDSIYSQLESGFVSPDIRGDGYFLVIPNHFTPDGISITADWCYENEVKMPESAWHGSWDILFKELKKQGIEYEMKYGVLIYMV